MWRITCVALAAASASWFLAELTVGEVLGSAGPAIVLVISALVFYIVVSTPRRSLDMQRVSQSRESVLLAAAARACLNVTGSRSRTLVILRPRDSEVASRVNDAARMVLLGHSVEDAVSKASRNLASYSAAAALQSVATLGGGTNEAEDEETRGLAGSMELANETKLPMFMTACFFAPLMILLYAIFSHSYSSQSLAELVVFEFMVVDLAFYLSATGRNFK